MTQTADPQTDPTLHIARLQLAMLRELAELGMVAARAFAGSAVAAAKAEEMILAEEYFSPEVGRAKACGARDAAESVQKVSRAVRLTLVLEMKVAEIVRDINAGKITYLNGFAGRKDAGETPAEQTALVRRPPDGASSKDRDSDARPRDADTERLVEFERPDILARAPFRETVEDICADIGATIDWKTRAIAAPDFEGSESRPAGLAPPDDPPPPAKLEAALSP